MEQKRHSVNLDPSTAGLLKELKFKRDLSYVTTIRRAVAMFKFAVDAKDEGNSLVLVDKKGKTIRELTIN